MDQIYCTLFNSNYLDKGLVLYHSMEKAIVDAVRSSRIPESDFLANIR